MAVNRVETIRSEERLARMTLMEMVSVKPSQDIRYNIGSIW